MSTSEASPTTFTDADLALRIEHTFQRLIGVRRLEDVEGPITLDEWSDSPMKSGTPLRYWVQSNRITVYSTDATDRTTHFVLTADRARDRVLAYRAEDPCAAHRRDIAHGERVAEHWLFCFANDWRRLSDPSHPAYRDPALEPAEELMTPNTRVGEVVRSRDMYSRLLARTLTALTALRAAGPSVPDQARLF